MTSQTAILRIIAGTSLALMAVLAPIANFGVLDPMRTTTGASADPTGVTLAIVCLIVVVALDVIVAFALYLVFAPVDRALSLAAAVLRLVYAAIFAFAVTFLLELRAGGPPTSEVLAEFDRWWDVGLIAFGAHLVVLGWLLCRYVEFPTWLGVLVWIAGIGYLFDSLLALSGGELGFEISTVTFIGEVALLFWLLVTGSRHLLQRRNTNASQR